MAKQFHGGNYHVTIIFDNMAKDDNYTFDEIAKLLEEVKQQVNRDYPITMEVIGITPDCSIYNKLHNRMIISNYYLVEASHKLAAFNKDKGTAKVALMAIPLLPSMLSNIHLLLCASFRNLLHIFQNQHIVHIFMLLMVNGWINV